MKRTPGMGVLEAERVGFEPTVTGKGHNAFRERPDQPLRHLSTIQGLRLSDMESGLKLVN